MGGVKDLVHRYARERQVQQARFVALSVVDAVDRLRGRTDPDLPPKRVRHFVGAGDFRAIGEEFVGHVRDLAGLQPTDRVLDVGSGIGRVALPLTRTLDERGGYDGVEIVRRGVTWCERNITPQHPRFRFHHADIHNRTYNPRGKLRAESYTFPFADDTFDVALLTSVFTHLLGATVERYVQELGRVLVPGGRVLATFFVLDAEAEGLLAAGASTLPFDHVLDGARVMNSAAPEDAVAYPEAFVREVFARHGFTLRDVHPGTWCGREGLSYQDIVIAVRG